MRFLEKYRTESTTGAAYLDQLAAIPADQVKTGLAELIIESGLDRAVLLSANLIVWTRRHAEQLVSDDASMPPAPDALALIATAEGRAGMRLFWLVDGNQGAPKSAEFHAAFELGFLGLVDQVMPKLDAICTIGAVLLTAVPETPPELDDWLGCLVTACLETTALRQLPEIQELAAALHATRRPVTPHA